MIYLNEKTLNIPYLIVSFDLDSSQLKILNQLNLKEGSVINTIYLDQQMVYFVHEEDQKKLNLDIARYIKIEPASERQDFIFEGNKTKQRGVILKCAMSFKNHFSLKDCFEKVIQIDSRIGEITVYRALKTLVEKKILTEVQLPNGEKKMEVGKYHHDHIICENCNHIIEFFDLEIELLQKKIAQQNNVTLSSHVMTLIASSCEKCPKD